MNETTDKSKNIFENPQMFIDVIFTDDWYPMIYLEDNPNCMIKFTYFHYKFLREYEESIKQEESQNHE